MTDSDILYDVADDGVATLTINRPEVMNALRAQTSRDMFEALDDVRTNDDVRCLLITGAGRGFCAGDDFQAIFLDEDRANRKIERQIRRIKDGESSLDDIFALEKPTIAAVNGPAVGYGMDIALVLRHPAGLGSGQVRLVLRASRRDGHHRRHVHPAPARRALEGVRADAHR